LKGMHFRLDTIIDMASIISPSQPTALSVMDMKAWYLQSFLSPPSCTLTGFEWLGSFYVFMHPAFGIKLSGFWCDQPASALADLARTNALAVHPSPSPSSSTCRTIRLAKYIDDWLMAVIDKLITQYQCEHTALHATNAIYIALCSLHGLVIGLSKCSLMSQFHKLWVGFIIDTSEHTFSLTEEKVGRVLSKRDEHASHHCTPTTSLRELDIQQWAGTVSSVALAFPGRAAAHHTKHANAALSSTTWPVHMTATMHEEAMFFDLLPQLNGRRKWRLQMHAETQRMAHGTHDS
jgi:hypothetical protein